MKLFRKGIIVMIVFMVLAASCATKGPTQRTEILDNKGAAMGIPTPQWVLAYVSGGNFAVEQLPEYKNQHCFVVSFNDASRDFAVSWVENANGPALVAQMISTTVSTDAQAKMAGERGGEVSAAFKSATEAMSNASFTGLRRVADWWQIVRNRSTQVQEAQAFALYSVEDRRLDEQIAINLANIVENNKELSAAERAIYNDLIADIRANGFSNR